MFSLFRSPLIMMAVILIASLTTTSTARSTETIIPQTVNDTIHMMLKGQRITSVTATAIDGVYEVVLGKQQIVYVYPAKEMLFAGQLYGKDGYSITARRVSEIAKHYTTEVLSTIDRTKALKVGSGKIELVEFVDIENPFCRQAEMFFKDKGTIFTRYVYFVPTEKSLNVMGFILSSSNSNETYEKIMNGKYDDKAQTSLVTDQAKSIIAYSKDLVKKLDVIGTPTIVWEKGFMEGYDQKVFEEMVKKENEKADK